VKLLLVTFFLRNEQKDYEQFFVMLRGSVQQWWHFIPQTCIVLSYFNAGGLSQRLLPHIDQQMDYFLITEIKPHEYQGWLPQEAWNWLNQVSNTVEPRGAFPPLPPPPRRIGS